MRTLERLLFLHPPQAEYFLPPLGPACLIAFLKHHRPDWSHRFIDLNVDYVHWLLQPHQITRACQTALSAFERLRQQPRLHANTLQEMQSYISTLSAVQEVLNAPQPLVDYITDPRLVADRATFEVSKNALGHMMHLHSITYGHVVANPTRLLWVAHGIEAWDSAVLLDVLAQPEIDPYSAFLQDHADLSRELAQCDALCITVPYYEQMLGAFSAAAYAKRLRPELPVLIGGSWITAIREGCLVAPALFTYVDAIVPFAGEVSLLEALQRLERGERLAGSDNVMALHDGHVVFREASNFPRIEALPVPDFDDYALERYLLPEPVLPFQITRGCYWGQCTFCTHHMAQGLGYSVAQTASIGEKLAYLAERYQTHRFYFIDEAIPPAKLRDIPEALRAHHLDILWMSECRLERSLTSAAFDELAATGCRLLLFGLETGSQRIMDLMKKGVRLEDAERCLRDCAEAGIDTSLFLMFGFPTETMDDVLATYHFIERNRPWITTLGTSVFALTADSPIAADPARFDITLEEEVFRGVPLKEDLAYRTHRGLDHEAAVAVCKWFEQTEVYRSIIRDRPFARRSQVLFTPSKRERQRYGRTAPRTLIVAPEMAQLADLYTDLEAVKLRFPGVQSSAGTTPEPRPGKMREQFSPLEPLASGRGKSLFNILVTSQDQGTPVRT